MVAAWAKIKGAALIQLVGDVVDFLLVHAVQNLFDLDQVVTIFVQWLRTILDSRLDLDLNDISKFLLVDRRFAAIARVMNHSLFLKSWWDMEVNRNTQVSQEGWKSKMSCNDFGWRTVQSAWSYESHISSPDRPDARKFSKKVSRRNLCRQFNGMQSKMKPMVYQHAGRNLVGHFFTTIWWRVSTKL